MDSIGGSSHHYPYLGSLNMCPYPTKYYTLGRYLEARAKEQYGPTSSPYDKKNQEKPGCSRHAVKHGDCVTCALLMDKPRPSAAGPQETFCIGERNLHYNFFGSSACRPFPDKYYRMGRYQEVAQRQMYEPTQTGTSQLFMPDQGNSVQPKKPPQAREKETLPLERLKTGDTFCIGERDIFYPFIGSNSLTPHPDKFFRMGRYQELAAQNCCGKTISPYNTPYDITCAKKGKCPLSKPLDRVPPTFPVSAKPITVPCLRNPNTECFTCAKTVKGAAASDQTRASAMAGYGSRERLNSSNGSTTRLSSFEGGDQESVVWPKRAPPRVIPVKEDPAIHPSLVYREPQLDFMDNYGNDHYLTSVPR